MMQMHASGTGKANAGILTITGQDAIDAIQEIVSILEGDPKTDWSKVYLEGLRQHFSDVNEVTLKETVVGKRQGHTLAAIQRMVPVRAK
jgi:hypothetical protein